MPAKKTGGLSRTTYIMIAVGSLGAYLAYRWYSNKQAANAATGLSGGTTIPGIAGSINSSTPVPPASLDQWIQQAISGAQYGPGYSNSNLYNDIQSWLNGNCVTPQGFNILGNLITTLGLPPGYAPPALSVCPSAPVSTPATPSAPATTTPPPAPAPAAAPNPGAIVGGTYNVGGNALYQGSGLSYIPSPALAQALISEGYHIVRGANPSSPNALYYDPGQFGSSGPIGIKNPTQAAALSKAGFKIVTIGHTQFYVP